MKMSTAMYARVVLFRSAASGVTRSATVPRGSLGVVCPNLYRQISSFKADDIQVTLADNLKPKPDSDKLGFGGIFTDHMLTIKWKKETGWGKPQICPVQEFPMHPATAALHYAIQLFEGMKAYRGVDNKVRIFRPEGNMQRMLRSTRRLCLPEFDGDEFLLCLKKLLSIDKEWVPYSTDCSLYIRPTHIGTTAHLMPKPCNESLLYAILTPAASVFPGGRFSPVKLLADPQFVRAFKGGVGDYKFGANYGPTIWVQEEAMKRGCQQVLWLFDDEHYVTEGGVMNLFMYWKNTDGEMELITPPLDGVILPGITRKSLLDLAREWNEFKVSERRFTIGDIMQGLKENRVYEIFGCGTAIVVCPVSNIIYEGETLEIPTMDKGAPITTRLMKTLTDIQYGRTIREDWTHVIE